MLKTGNNTVNYGMLYEDVLHNNSGSSTLDKIISNVSNMDAILRRGATEANNSEIVFHKLIRDTAGNLGALTNIHARLNADPNNIPEIRLGDMFRVNFTTIRPNNTYTPAYIAHMQYIHAQLEGVQASANDEMYHLCMPFRAVQNGTARPVDDADLSAFFGAFRYLTMQNFFDTCYPSMETLKPLVKAAKKAGILWEGRSLSSRPFAIVNETTEKKETTEDRWTLDSREGNGKKCSNNSCVADPLHPEYWCNQVPNGSGGYVCALGSD
tara:strand:+ start:256 stop:1059 length:804 start_codon:yes stop_codon:yes gene_type:complete